MEDDSTVPGGHWCVDDVEQDSATQDNSDLIVADTSEPYYFERFIDRLEQTIVIDSASGYQVFKRQVCPLFHTVHSDSISDDNISDDLCTNNLTTYTTILKPTPGSNNVDLNSYQALSTSSARVGITEPTPLTTVDEQRDIGKKFESDQIVTDTGQSTLEHHEFSMGSRLPVQTHYYSDMGTYAMQKPKARDQTDIIPWDYPATAHCPAVIQHILCSDTNRISAVDEVSTSLPSGSDTNIVSRVEKSVSIDDDIRKNQVSLRLLERRKTIEVAKDDLSGLEVRHTSNLHFSIGSQEPQRHHSLKSEVNIVWGKTIDTDEVSSEKRLFKSELCLKPFSDRSLDESTDYFSADMSSDTIVTSDCTDSFVDSLYTSDYNDSFLEQADVYSDYTESKSPLNLWKYEEHELTNITDHRDTPPVLSQMFVDLTKTYDIGSHEKIGLVDNADETAMALPLDRKLLYKVSDTIASLGRGASDVDVETAAHRSKHLFHPDCEPGVDHTDISDRPDQNRSFQIIDGQNSNRSSSKTEIYDGEPLDEKMQQAEQDHSFGIVRQSQEDLNDIQFDSSTKVRLYVSKLYVNKLPDSSIVPTCVTTDESWDNTGDDVKTAGANVGNQMRPSQENLQLIQPQKNTMLAVSSMKQSNSFNLEDRNNVVLPQYSTDASAHYFFDEKPLNIHEPVNVSSDTLSSIDPIKYVTPGNIISDYNNTAKFNLLISSTFDQSKNMATNTDNNIALMTHEESPRCIDRAVGEVSNKIHLKIAGKPPENVNASDVEYQNYTSPQMICGRNIGPTQYTLPDETKGDESVEKCVERTEIFLQNSGRTTCQRREHISTLVSTTAPHTGTTDSQQINEPKSQSYLPLSRDKSREGTEAADSFEDSEEGFVLVTSRRKKKLQKKKKKIQLANVADIATNSCDDTQSKGSQKSSMEHSDGLSCQKDENEIKILLSVSMYSSSEPDHADPRDADICTHIACGSIEPTKSKQSLIDKTVSAQATQCLDDNAEPSATDFAMTGIMFEPGAIIKDPTTDLAMTGIMFESGAIINDPTTDLAMTGIMFESGAITEPFVYSDEISSHSQRDTNDHAVSEEEPSKTPENECSSEKFICRMLEGANAQDDGEEFLHSDECGGMLLNIYTGGHRRILRPYRRFTKTDREATSLSVDNDSDLTDSFTKFEDDQKIADENTVAPGDLNFIADGTSLDCSITKESRKRGKGHKRKREGISNAETPMPNDGFSELNLSDDSGSMGASLEDLEQADKDFGAYLSDEDTEVSETYVSLFDQQDTLSGGVNEMNQHLDSLCEKQGNESIQNLRQESSIDRSEAFTNACSAASVTLTKRSHAGNEQLANSRGEVETTGDKLVLSLGYIEGLDDLGSQTETRSLYFKSENLPTEDPVPRNEGINSTTTKSGVVIENQHGLQLFTELVSVKTEFESADNNEDDLLDLCDISARIDTLLNENEERAEVYVGSNIEENTDTGNGTGYRTEDMSVTVYEQVENVQLTVADNESRKEENVSVKLNVGDDYLQRTLDTGDPISHCEETVDTAARDKCVDHKQAVTQADRENRIAGDMGNVQVKFRGEEEVNLPDPVQKYGDNNAVCKGDNITENVGWGITDEMESGEKHERKHDPADGIHEPEENTIDSVESVVEEIGNVQGGGEEEGQRSSEYLADWTQSRRKTSTHEDEGVFIGNKEEWRAEDSRKMLWDRDRKEECWREGQTGIIQGTNNQSVVIENKDFKTYNMDWRVEDICDVKWGSDEDQEECRHDLVEKTQDKNDDNVGNTVVQMELDNNQSRAEDICYLEQKNYDKVGQSGEYLPDTEIRDKRRQQMRDTHVADEKKVIQAGDIKETVEAVDNEEWKCNHNTENVYLLDLVIENHKNVIDEKENIESNAEGIVEDPDQVKFESDGEKEGRGDDLTEKIEQSEEIRISTAEWRFEDTQDVKWESDDEEKYLIEDLTGEAIEGRKRSSVGKEDLFGDKYNTVEDIDNVKCVCEEREREDLKDKKQDHVAEVTCGISDCSRKDIADRNKLLRAEDKLSGSVEWRVEDIGDVKWESDDEDASPMEDVADRNEVHKAEDKLSGVVEWRVEDIGDVKWESDDEDASPMEDMADRNKVLRAEDKLASSMEWTVEDIGNVKWDSDEEEDIKIHSIGDVRADGVLWRVEDIADKKLQIDDNNEDGKNDFEYRIQKINEKIVINKVEGIPSCDVQRKDEDNDSVKWQRDYKDKDTEASSLDGIKDKRSISPTGIVEDNTENNRDLGAEDTVGVNWVQDNEDGKLRTDQEGAVISDRGTSEVCRKDKFNTDNVQLKIEAVDYVKLESNVEKEPSNDIFYRIQEHDGGIKNIVTEWTVEDIDDVKLNSGDEEDEVINDILNESKVSSCIGEDVPGGVSAVDNVERSVEDINGEDVPAGVSAVDNVERSVEDINGVNWDGGEEKQDRIGDVIGETIDRSETNAIDRHEYFIEHRVEWGIKDIGDVKWKHLENKDERQGYDLGESNQECRDATEVCSSDSLSDILKWKFEDFGNVKLESDGDEPSDTILDRDTQESICISVDGRTNKKVTENVKRRGEDIRDFKWESDDEDASPREDMADRNKLLKAEDKLSVSVEWKVEDIGDVKWESDDEDASPIEDMADRNKVLRTEDMLSGSVEWRGEDIRDFKWESDDEDASPMEDMAGRNKVLRTEDMLSGSVEWRVEDIGDVKWESDDEEASSREDMADRNKLLKAEDKLSGSVEWRVEDIGDVKWESDDEDASPMEDMAGRNKVLRTEDKLSGSVEWKVEDIGDVKWESDDEVGKPIEDLVDRSEEIINSRSSYRTDDSIGDNVQLRVEVTDHTQRSCLTDETKKKGVINKSDHVHADTIQAGEIRAFGSTEHLTGHNVIWKIEDIGDVKWESDDQDEESKDDPTGRSPQSSADKMEYCVADNAASKVINSVKQEYKLDNKEIAGDPEDQINKNKSEVAIDIKKDIRIADSENLLASYGGNSELDGKDTVASIPSSSSLHSTQQEDFNTSDSATNHNDDNINEQIKVLVEDGNINSTQHPEDVGVTGAVTNSPFHAFSNSRMEFTDYDRSTNHQSFTNIDSVPQTSEISHSLDNMVNNTREHSASAGASGRVNVSALLADVTLKTGIAESKQNRKKKKKKKNAKKHEKKNVQTYALEQDVNVNESFGEHSAVSEVKGVAAVADKMSVYSCPSDSTRGESLRGLSDVLVMGIVRQAEKYSANSVAGPQNSVRINEACLNCEYPHTMEPLSQTADVENNKTESTDVKDEISRNETNAALCGDCLEDNASVLDSGTQYQTDYVTRLFIDRCETLLPATPKATISKNLLEDVIRSKTRAEQLVAQNPEASQKQVIHDLNSTSAEPTLTPAGHLMSEIGLLEMSAKDQWDSLRVAAQQHQLYLRELHILSHACDEAQKKLQASPVTAESVGELRQLMAERTNLTEQIKSYNTQISEVNEKIRQLALDSAQLSPSAFRKHYHPESAYADYFAATSQNKRGMIPFHSPGKLFYDALPEFNFSSSFDEDSQLFLTRLSPDELENWKQSEHQQSLHGMTDISLELPRLIPPPRTDSIPRPTWSGEILSTASSSSDMSRGTSVSHCLGSPRTMARAFEASASSAKTVGSVSASAEQITGSCNSTTAAEAGPEIVQSNDASDTNTTLSNSGESPPSVLHYDTDSSSTIDSTAKRLTVVAESAQKEAPAGGLPTETSLMQRFINEHSQMSPDNWNASSDSDPETNGRMLATSATTVAQQLGIDSQEQDDWSPLAAGAGFTSNVQIVGNENQQMIPGDMRHKQDAKEGNQKGEIGVETYKKQIDDVKNWLEENTGQQSSMTLPLDEHANLETQLLENKNIQEQINKQLEKLSELLLHCDSLSDEDPIAARQLCDNLLALQRDLEQAKQAAIERQLTLEAAGEDVNSGTGRADKLYQDINNHVQLINEIAQQGRHSGSSHASNITTDAEVKENWERLSRDLTQKTENLECTLRTQKLEDLVKISLHAPAKHSDSNKELENVTRLVADLNSTWNLQQTQLLKKQLHPNEALAFQQKHQSVLQNISNWLDLAEQQMFTVPLSTEEQVRHNENLRRQIHCLQDNVNGMNKQAKDQVESTDMANRELIEKCHHNLNERLKMIDTTTKLQAEDLHSTETQWKQYQGEVTNLQRQLQDIQNVILLPAATQSLDQLLSNNQQTEVQLKMCENQLQELKTTEFSLTQKYPKGVFMSELVPLQSKYTELLRKAVEKKSSTQNLVTFCDQYKKMLKDCGDFIETAENKLRADSMSAKDLNHLKQQLAAYKEFFGDIEVYKATLDSLANNCDPSTRSQFQQQHASLSARIHVLVDQASLHGQRLERLTRQWADLEEKYTMLQKVLFSLEAQMPEPVDSEDSLAVIHDKCNKYKWLQGELAANRDSVFEVLDKGKQILHSISCPSLENTITELTEQWVSLNTKLTQELKRTESLGDLLSVFETELAVLSSWLMTAKMKLEGFKNLSAANLQNISVVRSQVEKILEFRKDVADQVHFKNKVMSIGNQLLQNKTYDTMGLTGRLQDCEEEWKQLEKGIADTQEYLLQVQMKLMPSRQALKELTDWVDGISKSLEKDAHFDTKTSAEVGRMLKKYKSYQTELAGRQMSVDFVNQTVLVPKAAEVYVSSEKLEFAENLKELNKQWQQVTTKINDKLNELEDVYSKWEEYGNAVENLQSWFHQQEDKIQSYQRIGNEVGVKQSLKDCSALQQQLQYKQAELAATSALGNYLIRLSHDSPDSQLSVRDSLSTLGHNMKRLEEDTAQQQSVLQDMLGQWTQYHIQLSQLNEVVAQADYALDNYKLIRGDITTLQSQVNKLKDLHTHLENNSDQLKSFSAIAGQLRQVCEPSVQADIQKTVSDIQKKWTQLSTDLMQRCNEYEHYLDEWQLFENQYSRIQDWLDDKGAMFTDLSSTNAVSIETLTKCTELQQELDSFQTQVSDLHRQNEMLAKHMNPSTVSIMKSRQSAIDQKMLALKEKLSQLSVMVSNDLSMHEKFNEIFEVVEKFLSYAEIILGYDDPVNAAEQQAIKLRCQQLRNLLLLFSSNHEQLDEVNDLGYQLALNKIDATRLRQLNHKWYKLYEDTKDKSKILQGNLLQQQNFASKCEAWKTFMTQTEQKLAEKVKGNLGDLSDQHRSIEQFENELYSQQQIIHAILSDGQKMISAGEVEDSDEFERKLNLLFEQWQNVSRKASQRKATIVEIMNKWHEFNTLSQQLKDWLKDTEKNLEASPSDSNSLQSIKNSVEKVQHEFQVQEATYNTILDLGGNLLQHADDKAAKEIEATLSNIQHNRHKVLTAIEEHNLQLEDIDHQWLYCETEVDDMLCQLTAIRRILNADLPTTYDELQLDISRCKDIEKAFIESESKEQSLLAKKEQLVKIMQKEDMNLLQQRIQLLTKQREELQHQTQARADKIIDTLYRWTDFNKHLKSLKDWVGDMTIKISNQDMSVEDLLAKLENEYKQEAENKEVQKALILEQGRQLMKVSDDIRATEIGQKLLQLEDKWQHLKGVMDTRYCKLRETALNLKQLDASMSNLSQWLSAVENVLNEDIIFNSNDLREMEAKLQDSKELQYDIERHAESVTALLNLCKMLLNDSDACPTETEFLALEHSMKNLEKRWQTICIVSPQRKIRVEETWQLWGKFQDDCDKFSKWITQMEQEVGHSEIDVSNVKTAKEYIKKYEDLQCNIHDHLSDLEHINRIYCQLVKDCTDSDSAQKDMMTKLNERWDTLHHKVTEIMKKLCSSSIIREDFEATRISLLKWLTDFNEQLTKLQSSSALNMEAKVGVVQRLNAEIHNKRYRINYLDQAGMHLIQKADSQEALRVQRELDSFRSFYKTVHDRFVTMSLAEVEDKSTKYSSEDRQQQLDADHTRELHNDPGRYARQQHIADLEKYLKESPPESPAMKQRLPAYSSRESVSPSRATSFTTTKFELHGQRSQSPSLLRSRSPTLKSLTVTRSVSPHRRLSPSQRSPSRLAIGIAEQTKIRVLMEQLADTLDDCNIKLLTLEQTLQHSEGTKQSMRTLAECETAVDHVKTLDRLLKTETGLHTIGSVDEQVKSVVQRWEYLQSYIKDFRLSQERYDIQFESDIERMLTWLDEAEALKSRSQCTIFNIQQEDVCRQYKEFLSQMESKKEDMLFINQRSVNQKNIRTELSRKRQLKAQLVDLNRRWKLILSWAANIQRDIQSSWIEHEEFLTRIDYYHLWLEKIETQVRHCEPVNSSVNQSVLQEKYGTLQELHREVINNQATILTLKETADKLLESMELPEFSTARDKIYIVLKRVQTLTHLISSYITALEKRLKISRKRETHPDSFDTSEAKSSGIGSSYACRSSTPLQLESLTLRAGNQSPFAVSRLRLPFLSSRTTDRENLSTELNQEIVDAQHSKRTAAPALLTRVLRAALPIHLLLLLLWLLFWLIPVCEDENSCMRINNLQHSVMPVLRYTDGAPPI